MNNAPLWKLSHKIAARPASLLMIIHKCQDYYSFATELADFCEVLGNENLNKEQFIDGLSTRAVSIVDDALKLLRSLGNISPTVTRYIEDLGEIYNITGITSYGTVITEMISMREMVRQELEGRKFYLIPPPDDKKFKQSRPFGKAVFVAFPSARQELTDANTAFATGLYTASVFHLMRAVEYALRVLAADRRVKVMTKGTKAYPLDLATWEAILQSLETEVAKVAQWPKTKGQLRVQATKFYGTALAEVRGFKDTWRNHIMHSRHSYIREDAIQIMTHVERFMSTLATRIGEETITPKVWTKNELI
jgi:hypothetical protein